MFSTSTGIINNLIVLFGGEKVAFTTDPRIFKSLYVLSGVWQNMGWNSIIYMQPSAARSHPVRGRGA